MTLLSLTLSIHFIGIVIWMLYKKYNPQVVLLVAGCAMLILSIPLGMEHSINVSDSGFGVVAVFKTINSIFLDKISGVGFMIMVVGGFVAYMRQIGASDALVYISLQPLSIFKKSPYFAAVMLIPIGQVLFMSIPSATGLGLLLSISFLPVLLSLGVSRLTAISVITACTVFDLGPASANTARAAELIGKSKLNYFFENQLPLTIPLTIVLTLLFFFVNKYFDKKEGHIPIAYQQEEMKLKAPLVYAILPLLPIILMLISSWFNVIRNLPVSINTSTAMLITLFIALIFEIIRTGKLKASFSLLRVFFEGMGKIFTTVVTLVIAAAVFARGIISIGFIASLVDSANYLGLNEGVVGVVLTVLVFSAAILTGSGSASFFSVAPLVEPLYMGQGSYIMYILQMQMASSMGRAASPISGVVIATSDIAQVSPFQIAKRNAVSLIIILVVMLIFNSFI